MNSNKKITQKDLEKMCAYWQKILRLQDWDVTVEFRTVDTMPRMEGCSDIPLGINYFNYQEEVSKICIIEHTSYPVDSLTEYDAEAILVHELGHLYFANHFIDPEEEISRGIEVVINKFTNALLRLKRSEAP